jgi:hypothetical protein
MIADGQNILDYCLERYGTLDQLVTLIQDNDLTINSRIASGQDVTIQNNLGNSNIKDFFQLAGRKPKNNQETELPPLPGGAYNNDYNIDYN